MPFIKDGKLTALMAAHDSEPRDWTDGELTLIRETTERSWAYIERTRSQAALQESEQRFRTVANSAPIMIWVTDPDGKCTYLNQRWYEFTGQEPGAGEGYGWLEAVHPDDRPRAEAAFVSANAEQRDYSTEFRLLRADGVYRWTIDAAAARFAADGSYLGYVGSVMDIDERRRRFESLIDNVTGWRSRPAKSGCGTSIPFTTTCSGRSGSRRCSGSAPTSRFRSRTFTPAFTLTISSGRPQPLPKPPIPPSARSTMSNIAPSARKTA